MGFHWFYIILLFCLFGGYTVIPTRVSTLPGLYCRMSSSPGRQRFLHLPVKSQATQQEHPMVGCLQDPNPYTIRIHEVVLNMINVGVSIVMGLPQNLDGLSVSRKTPLKWMIWGYPYFRKPPHDDLSISSTCACSIPSLLERAARDNIEGVCKV